MDEQIVVPLGFFLMVVVLAIGIPLARAYARTLDRRSQQASLPPGLEDRLLQLQHSVDSMALEVERISEAQRFTSRLLAEGASRAPAAPAAPPPAPSSRQSSEAP